MTSTKVNVLNKCIASSARGWKDFTDSEYQEKQTKTRLQKNLPLWNWLNIEGKVFVAAQDILNDCWQKGVCELSNVQLIMLRINVSD